MMGPIFPQAAAPLAAYEPDIDICSECGEHAGFTEDEGSDCCGAAEYDTDCDLNEER